MGFLELDSGSAGELRGDGRVTIAFNLAKPLIAILTQPVRLWGLIGDAVGLGAVDGKLQHSGGHYGKAVSCVAAAALVTLLVAGRYFDAMLKEVASVEQARTAASQPSVTL